MATEVSSRIDEARGKKITTYRNPDGSTYTIEVNWGTPRASAPAPAPLPAPPSFTAPGAAPAGGNPNESLPFDQWLQTQPEANRAWLQQQGPGYAAQFGYKGPGAEGATSLPTYYSGITPATAALLQAGTQRTGIGPTGQVGVGIMAGGPGTASGALTSDPAAYAAAMRPFTAPPADDTAARLAREAAARQRQAGAVGSLIGLEQQRQAAAAGALGQYQESGVATRGQINRLQTMTQPLAQGQAAAAVGWDTGDADWNAVWDRLQAWLSQRERA